MTARSLLLEAGNPWTEAKGHGPTERKTTPMEPRQRAAFVSAYTKVLTSAWSNESFAASLSANPQAALAEKGLDIPRAEVDLMAGENRKDAYVAKNPAGQLPALELERMKLFSLLEVNSNTSEYLFPDASVRLAVAEQSVTPKRMRPRTVRPI